MKTTITIVLNWLMYPETPIQKPKGEKALHNKLSPVLIASNIRKYNRFLFMMAAFFVSHSAIGQLMIPQSTLFTGTGHGMITVDSSIINQGEFIAEDQFTLVLGGEGIIQSTSTIYLPVMIMTGDHYTVQSDINIMDSLLLQSGTITATSSSQLVLLDSAFAVSIDSSHVNGMLFTRGEGMKFFPIGKDGVYTPVTLTNVEGNNTLVGMEPLNYDFGLGNLPPGVTEVSHDWHWWMLTEDGFEGSPIILPVTDQDLNTIDNTNLIPVVVQSDFFQSTSSNLGGDYMANDGTITSVQKANGAYLLMGLTAEIKPVIHNIITPGNDDDNPYLVIEGVNALANNTVVLIDRWGNEVYRKNNFRNFNDTDNIYDGEFDFLPSGNYVCLLSYGNQSKTSMVTVIKE